MAFTWVNKGSYQDLSNTVLPADPISSLVPTSQSDGGEPHDNSQAMTAPGTVPPLETVHLPGQVDVHPAPKISTAGPKMPPSTDGKPQTKGQDWTEQGPPRWTPTTVPKTIRET